MTTTLEATKTAAIPQGGGLHRRLNMLTAMIGGALFAWIFWFLAHHFLDPTSRTYSDEVTVSLTFGWIVGFWLGIGAFNAPFQWLVGRDNTRDDDLYLAGQGQGKAKYWKFTTDHKVVGVQYIIMTMVLLGAGGILAMAIRTELIIPGTSRSTTAS